MTVAPSTPAYHTDHSVQKTYPTTTGPQLSNKPVLRNHDAAVSRDSPREKEEVPRKRKKEENDVIDVDEYGLDTVDIGMLLLAWGYNVTHAHTHEISVCVFVCVCVCAENSQDAESSQSTRKGLKAANVPNCHYPCFLFLSPIPAGLPRSLHPPEIVPRNPQHLTRFRLTLKSNVRDFPWRGWYCVVVDFPSQRPQLRARFKKVFSSIGLPLLDYDGRLTALPL